MGEIKEELTLHISKKPKQEFTKKMYLFNVKFAVAVTIIIIALMIFSAFVERIDLSPCAYIIPPIWIEVGVFSAFYVWKAKNENISKYGGGKNEHQQEI